MIPLFGPNARQYFIKELNERVIAANLRGITNTEYVRRGGDTFTTMLDIKNMARKAERFAMYEMDVKRKLMKAKENSDEGE